VNHVVALSGGADSTAMALRLMEVEPQDYLFVCTPTGDELPATVDHWVKLKTILGRPLIPLTMGQSLDSLIDHFQALPNWRQRWCTRILKIEPFQAFVLARQPATVYVGLRADEEARPGAVYQLDAVIAQRWPLREWGWDRVRVEAYLEERGVVIPPRTDCARCFFQTLREWWVLWQEHPEIYAAAEQQEQQIGHTFRSPGRDTWPAGLLPLRQVFESGREPKARARDGGCRACRL
jgi:3'-phosphoadenosine 5'-phosphosulfate sulfotransferase (PAPS reductase)/FAD synthetase